nr:PREDICTED: calmodulin-like protein 12 [Latimeria chalumnae]|eukprot:XP_014352851.1 PREDICTED: calmodulin-like protein 12 [Latimeria chalumnae]
MGGWVSKKAKEKADLMKAIQDYLAENKLRLWDFFRNIDKEGTQMVTIEDFRSGLRPLNLPLDKNDLESLINRLDVDKDGKIDYSELLQGHKDFRKKSRKMEHRKPLKTLEEKAALEIIEHVRTMMPADLKLGSMFISKNQ